MMPTARLDAMGGGSFGGPLAAPGKAYSFRVLE